VVYVIHCVVFAFMLLEEATHLYSGFPNLGLRKIYKHTSLTLLQSSFENAAAVAVGKYRNVCYFQQILSRW
jgi:hypothetical protein